MKHRNLSKVFLVKLLLSGLLVLFFVSAPNISASNNNVSEPISDFGTSFLTVVGDGLITVGETISNAYQNYIFFLILPRLLNQLLW